MGEKKHHLKTWTVPVVVVAAGTRTIRFRKEGYGRGVTGLIIINNIAISVLPSQKQSNVLVLVQ